MDKSVKIPSPYGPVEVSLKQCDAPECSSCVQPDHMVGWHKLSPQGVEIGTFGQLPGPLDFCSLTCLVKTVGLISGTP